MEYINGENLIKPIIPDDFTKIQGEEIIFPAYVYQIRKGTGFSFVMLRCGRYIYQAVYIPQLCKTSISELCEGAYIRVCGKIKEEKRAPFGIEITMNDFSVISKPEEEFAVSVSDNALHCSVETNLKNRSTTLRRPDQRAILKISAEITKAFSDFMNGNGFTQIHTPGIVKANIHPTSYPFRLKYFGEDAVLSTDKHIYMQSGVAFFDRVFSVSEIFRSDKHNSTRHLNEYTSLDFEFAFAENIYDIINLTTALLRHITDSIKNNCGYEMELCGVKEIPSAKKILTLSFTEAKEILGLKEDKTDLDPTDCRYICQYAKENGSDFVFITHFPSQRCPLNFMDTPENNGLCQSFILLLDGFEIAGGGKKIHSFDEQTRKITQNGLALSDYSDFLELHKYALPPHGGCSIGLERLTMKLLDLENIKLARLFARDMHHLSL